MTDKEKIKEEIEYRLSSGKYSINSKQALEDIIVFIDSLLEEHNEDLEEEYDNYFKKHEMDIVLNPYTNCKDIARHFAEWQKQKDEKTLQGRHLETH